MNDTLLSSNIDEDERSMLDDVSVVDDGSEIDAWEKALEERKSKKAARASTAPAPQDASISDTDDF